MTGNAVVCYDMRMNVNETVTQEYVTEFAERWFKEWAFQKEKGDNTGYIHWQFRGSLKVKLRREPMKARYLAAGFEGYCEPTTTGNLGVLDYCSKEHTRVDGPWRWNDKETTYIPVDMRETIVWRPWQAGIIKIMEDTPNRRTINCIINEGGNIGKSWMALWLHAHKKAIYIPYFDGAKDMMRMVYGQKISSCYFIDLPKALSHKSQHEIYAGIEMLKTGFIYKDRYHFQSKIIDPVHVFVFTNKMPDVALLSKDRWRFHYVESAGL